MARITVEDCLEKVDNRFALVMLAVKRTKQLYAGADPLVKCENREIITALREIAAGHVKQIEPEKPDKKKSDWRPPTGKELEKLREDWDHCT